MHTNTFEKSSPVVIKEVIRLHKYSGSYAMPGIFRYLQIQDLKWVALG